MQEEPGAKVEKVMPAVEIQDTFKAVKQSIYLLCRMLQDKGEGQGPKTAEAGLVCKTC